MKATELEARLVPAEDPDWGYARNLRVLLRRSNSEFCQSVFCVPYGPLVVPNRDYPYEGLSAVCNQENWKFLDSIAFGLKVGEAHCTLQPLAVRASSWSATYEFAATLPGMPGGKLELEYYLLRSQVPTLSVQAKLSWPEAKGAVLVAVPLADIRFMYAQSSPEQVKVDADESGMLASYGGKAMLASGRPAMKVAASPKVVQWFYKLGAGERAVGPQGVCFRGESRSVLELGSIETAFIHNRSEIQVSCSNESKSPNRTWASRPDDLKAELLEQSRLFKGIGPMLNAASDAWGPQAANALAGRASVLFTKFDYASKPPFPDAGAFWFRNPWLRDVFETALANFPLFYSLDKRRLKSWVSRAMQLQSGGLIPNKLPELSGGRVLYNGLDSTLLCFLVGLEYAKAGKDSKLRSDLKGKVLESIAAFRDSRSLVSLDSNGLLACPASYGWVDAYYTDPQTGLRFPDRLPISWARQIVSETSSREAAQREMECGKYYLAEVNAAWMRFLLDVAKMAGGEDTWAEELIGLLKENFARTFWKDGFTCHIARAPSGECFAGDELEGRETSMGLVATALLPEIFSEPQVGQVLDNAAKTIFARRDGLLFGATVKNILNAEPFLDDRQYHASVVWPRDTPYIIKLLNRLGGNEKREQVGQLLQSNLAHQMQEGAVYFNHELFSLPEGTNPIGKPSSNSSWPVPVKNPAQLWSQWVQPYADYLLG